MSYLACTAPSDYKRGPSNNPLPKDPEPRHFHRPGECDIVLSDEHYFVLLATVYEEVLVYPSVIKAPV